MKTASAKFIITDIIKCALILLFCYTAVNKWIAYDDFMYQLQQSPFIHGGYQLLSFALPSAELSICLLLVLPATTKIAFAAAAVLLILFTVYIICMLLYAPNVPCSCGGFVSFLSWKQHLALNGTMAVLSLWGYRLQQHDRHQQQRT